MNVDISRVTIESIIKDYITKNSPQKEKWNNKINKNSQSEGRYEKGGGGDTKQMKPI